MSPTPQPLWRPPPTSPNAPLHIHTLMHLANTLHSLNLTTFAALHAWSVADPAAFWALAWSYFRLPHAGAYAHAIQPNVPLAAVPKFFAGVRLNFAECLLEPLPVHARGKEDAGVAVTEVREGAAEVRDVTWGELRARVARMARAMRARGVGRGDRVAVVAGNGVQTLVVFLAVTSLGGLFSSSSTDMGVRGVLDRMVQIRPRWVFMDDAALYNGKVWELREKMQQVVEGMKGVGEFGGVVSIPRWENAVRDVSQMAGVTGLQEWMGRWWDAPGVKLEYERVEFSDPFLIVYSSGTTGIPKCIVHSVGGVLSNAMKEGLFHRNYSPDRVTLQYTTTGWIMYLSSILTLLHGARIVAYDGSPFLPTPTTFLQLVASQRVTNLGVSPRYFSTLANAGIAPRRVADLSALRAVSSTGMVLPVSLFHWFYSRNGFPAHAQLCNISGGTDLAGCFGCENPITPVYPGGTQGPSLGMKVEVFDSAVETPADGPPPKGVPVPDGEQGELVATVPFPNMPIMFYPGDAASQKKYFDAYYARFENVWAQGDFIEKDPVTGGITFLGRADGVLNPSGVRFGSAEIYNVLEQHFGGRITDSIVVGQRRPGDVDEKVMLFVKMPEGAKLEPALVREMKGVIARECSKRHVPAYVFETPDIPTTVNLKKVELPVKQIVSGKVVKPSGTLLNPQSLDYYYQFAKVEELLASKSKL